MEEWATMQGMGTMMLVQDHPHHLLEALQADRTASADAQGDI
jgi:hypothetical protein